MKYETYYTTKGNHNLVFKYCGYEECTPDFITYPHTRSEYLVHYITKGSGIYTCEGHTYNLSKGDLFVIIPNQLINYQANPNDPFHFTWFAFSGAKSASVVAQMGISEDLLVRRLHPRYAIDELTKNMIELLNSGAPTNDFEVHALMFQMISNIIHSYHLAGSYINQDRDIIFEHVDKAKAFIKCNYMLPITVQDVVKHVGLERSYFSKIFHKYTGCTAQKYILSIRLNNSKLLLERTNFNIKEISLYVGIKDEYYFSRAFKQVIGCSPRQYRVNIHQQLDTF